MVVGGDGDGDAHAVSSNGGGLFSDDAVASEADDRLGRTQFAGRLVELLDGVADETSSAVVGLIGAWGSGKTSVLHLVRSRMTGDDRWSVVDFNPWVTADVAGLTREFIATVQSALPAHDSARKRLASYARRIAPFTSLAAPFGLDPSKAMSAAADSLSGDVSLEGERRRLEQALSESGHKILVLIDDVDRLHADELTSLLKLVRLVGRLPNVFYVLAYDETTLLDILGRSDVACGMPSRALAYLDKIVQLRLDLPPVPQVLLDRMMDETLEQILTANSLELSREDAERFGVAYHFHLRQVLAEPRHIKRYFGQVGAVLPLVAAEVDLVDFALVTFVRTFYP
ncbi:MAG: P-loop NTPase fold protein, partial [Propioniciclava sp.]